MPEGAPLQKRKSLAHAYNKLPLSQKLLYACPRGAWVGISLLLQTTVRVYYIEGLGMGPEQLAVAISLCKSLDFLIGFAVGYASDHLKSKYGRRKPFIFFGTPIWLCVMFAINNPAILGFGAIEKQTMNGTICTGIDDCGDLKACVDNAINDGSFPSYHADIDEAQTSAPMSLLIYFTVLYFLFYSVGVSSTIIPYDALGMEMTDDFDERSSLFGLKAGMQFVGFMVLAVSGLTFSTMYEDDVAQQILLSSCLWFVLMAGTFGALLLFLKTKPQQPDAELEETPLIPSIRAIFRNKPYINYLWLKVPLSIAGLVPVNMLLFYVKLVLHEENSNLALGKVMSIVVFTAVASVPVISHCMVKYGKRESLLAICAMLGTTFMLAAMTPPSIMVMYILAIFMGVGSVGSQIIPDAMLADIIDYDELHTGQRNEGLYTVVETNLQQFIEIPSGTVPFLIFSYLGYVSNSGCQCGCGSKCKDPFTRWVCPGDIGYACSTSFTADLIVGPTDRDPPCAYQSSTISMAVTLLGVVLPGACYILAILPVYFTAITKPVHSRIMRQIHRRQDGCDSVNDPVTGETILCKLDKEAEKRKNVFTPRELEDTAEAGSDHRVLGRAIKRDLAVGVFLAAADVSMMAAYPLEVVITFGALSMSLILVVIAWSYLRLKSYNAMVKDGSIQQVFDKQGATDELMTNPAHDDGGNKATM